MLPTAMTRFEKYVHIPPPGIMLNQALFNIAGIGIYVF